MIKELLSQMKLPEIPEDKEIIKEILQREIYGYMPEKPDSIAFEKVGDLEGRFPCRATLSLMKCIFTVKGQKGEFQFRTALHNDGKKRPFFIHINFRENTPDLYQPTEEILDNGFDIISFNYTHVTSDDSDFSTGIAPIFVDPQNRKPTDCGKIILWSWAASRLIDYAETLPCLDMNNLAVLGHSRLGKTALVTGMFDERVVYTISNNSGCAGAKITRGKIGETVADITKNFPQWFCENYKKYAGNHENMPFDQHFLLGSVAPRYLYVASSSLDTWSDPDSEYLCCHAVSEYHKNKGAKGFVAPDRLAKIGEHFHDGSIGYHIKDGDHYFSRYDWNMYMEYIRSKM